VLGIENNSLTKDAHCGGCIARGDGIDSLGEDRPDKTFPPLALFPAMVVLANRCPAKGGDGLGKLDPPLHGRSGLRYLGHRAKAVAAE